MASVKLNRNKCVWQYFFALQAPSHSLRPTERWEGAFFCVVGPHSEAKDKEPPQWQGREPYEDQKTLITGAISRYLSLA